MKNMNSNCKRAIRLATSLALAGSSAWAQQEISEEEGVFSLSPFQVNANSEEGYRATSTLAGTRIQTSMKDVGSSISVYTKEFMEDIGATDAVSLLTYTLGTEVAGLGGTISNTNNTLYGLDFVAERLASSSTTRVRGLAAADNTRDYFGTSIPMETYNIERVTVNRGANNLLFGLGSPAGIIDRSLADTMSEDAYKVELRTDSNGSLRSVLDANQVLVEGRLQARVIALYDWKEYQQAEAFDKNQRVYGAFDYMPAKNAKLSARFEVGERDGAPPYLAPPRDRFTPFWTQGKPIRAAGTNNLPDTRVDLAGAQPPRGAILVYDDPSSQSTNLGFIALPGQGDGLVGAVIEPGDPLYDVVAPEDRGNYRPRHVGMEGLDRYNRDRLGNPYAQFLRSPQILDRSIFDYENESLAGRNDRRGHEFQTINLTWSQEFLSGNFGYELAYDEQSFDSNSMDFLGTEFRARNIGIDVSETMIDGADNPNFGRAFIVAAPDWAEEERDSDTTRLTAFYRFDGKEKLGDFGRWIGTHTFTGLYEYGESQILSTAGRAMAMRREYGEAVGFNEDNIAIGGLNANLQSMMMVYVSDNSLLDIASPSGVGLSGLNEIIPLPSQGTVTYIESASSKFKTNTFDMYSYPYDKSLLTAEANLFSDIKESSALAWQSRLFEDHIIGTLGWRKDKIRQYDAGAAPYITDVNGLTLESRDLSSEAYALPETPIASDEASTFSWGVVGHAPDSILKALPSGMDLSVHYSSSENFRPTLIGRTPFGGLYENESGKSEEMGFSVSLNNKISAKVNWYETSQKNIVDDRISGFYDNGFRFFPELIYANNNNAAIAAAGFQLPSSSIQETYGINLVDNGDGTSTLVSDTSIITTDIVDAVSEGVEIDLVGAITDRWTVSLNIARQEAVRRGTGQTAGAELLDYVQQIVNLPSELKGPVDEDMRLRAQTQVLTPFRALQFQDGNKAQELREWRVNAVTNYKFAEDSQLKGWNVGGGVRWQDANVVGNQIILDDEFGVIPDVSNPLYGEEEVKVDLWVGHTRRIWNNVDWTIKLNVTNAFDEDDLIEVWANPEEAFTVGSHQDVYRIGLGREWFLTSTFEF